MIVVTAILGALAFAAAFHVSGLVGRARDVAAITREALRVVSSHALDDHVKEVQVQRASKRLFVAFAAITLRAAAVLLAPVAMIALADLAYLAEFDRVVALSLSWPFLLGTSAFALLATWWLR